MEDLIQNLKNYCNYFVFDYLLYADDIVFIVNYKFLKALIICLLVLTKKYNLIINPSKSGIFLIKNHEEI